MAISIKDEFSAVKELKYVDSINVAYKESDVKTVLDGMVGGVVVVESLSGVVKQGVVYKIPVRENNVITGYQVYVYNGYEKVFIGNASDTASDVLTSENVSTGVTSTDNVAYVTKIGDKLAVYFPNSSSSSITQNSGTTEAPVYSSGNYNDIASTTYVEKKATEIANEKLSETSATIANNFTDKFIRRYTIQERLKDGLGIITEDRSITPFIVPDCTSSSSDDICRRNHNVNFHSMTSSEYKLLLQNFPHAWVENYKDIEGLDGMVLWASNNDKEDGTDSDYHVFLPGTKDSKTEYGTCVVNYTYNTMYDTFGAEGDSDKVNRYVPTYRRAVGYQYVEEGDYVEFNINGRPFAVAKYNEGATHSNSDASTWYGSKYMFGATTASTGTTTQADAPFWNATTSAYTKYDNGEYLSAHAQDSRILSPAIYQTYESSSSTNSVIEGIPRRPMSEMESSVSYIQDKDVIVDLGYITSLSYDFGGARHIGELTVFFTTGDTFDFDVTGVDHVGDFDPQPNKRYVMSVLNGVAVLGEITEEE